MRTVVTAVLWGTYWGPPILGNYHVHFDFHASLGEGAPTMHLAVFPTYQGLRGEWKDNG